MKSRSRSGGRPSTLLILVCLILGAVISLELSFGPLHPAASPVAPGPPKPAVLPAADPDFTLPPLDDFSEIVERPLFIPSRRPLSPESGSPGSGPGEAERRLFTLKGVVISADERMAVLQRRRNREVLRVVEGQRIDGWLVETIMPEGVVLRQGEVREEVELRDILRTRPVAPAGETVLPREAGGEEGAAEESPPEGSEY